MRSKLRQMALDVTQSQPDGDGRYGVNFLVVAAGIGIFVTYVAGETA